MRKQKFYVVWKGHRTGVFDSWEECLLQTINFSNPKYKSFKTRREAEYAYTGVDKGENVGGFESKLPEEYLKLIGNPVLESISIYGTGDRETGIVEYQGVNTSTGEIIFKNGPFSEGNFNIIEFIALVHALAYCKQNQLDYPIYCNRKKALKWIDQKRCMTSQSRNETNQKLFELIDRANNWLRQNNFINKVIKWEEKAWGQSHAYFQPDLKLITSEIEHPKSYLNVIIRIIYVLALEDGCFYIGQTQKSSFERRMKEHFDLERKSRKSVWVQEHKAVKVLETSEFKGTVPEGEILENEKTLQYMRIHGIDKVRGGYYCVANYNEILKCLQAHGHNIINNKLIYQ
ncbi:hypothetical protein C3K47_19100 [Solitalea longa]|uniref:Ribonuclease H n=1 Tax=Solitalea longa TaxID=2079460 RepID=A0A2S4ZXE1_9SPHI|nr:viroplasmin family protein [Solitalea longa]POY34657.1 hypothetical protein C3K47_19100 [Solitalea longa]